MRYEDNPRSIKFHVKKYILENEDALKGRRVIDFPAGNGVTSKILGEVGAVPVALDLFPEYFRPEEWTCQRADINDGLPVGDQDSDYLICQEGIEHFTDQVKAMREFNRVLKPGGILVITTPNYSTLRAKVSYMLLETERIGKMMPPNEYDTIWMSKPEVADGIYFGHAFLIGIQKLRLFAKMAGFDIKAIRKTRIKPTSVILFPFLYPFVYTFSLITYRKNLKKAKSKEMKATYREQFKLAVNPKILTDGHLFVEFEKSEELEEIAPGLRSRDSGFGVT